MTFRSAGSAAFALAMLTASLASAETQVSDQFIDLAKAIEQKYAAAELRKVCEKLDPGRVELCEPIVQGTIDLLTIATSKRRDDAAIERGARRFAGEIAQAALVSNIRGTFEESIFQAIPEATTEKCKDPLRELFLDLTVCAEQRLIHPALAPKRDACAALEVDLTKAAEKCAMTVPCEGDALEKGLKALAGWVEKKAPPSNKEAMTTVAVSLRVLSTIDEVETDEGLFGLVSSVATEAEDGLPWDAVARNAVFSWTSQLQAEVESAKTCTGLEPVRARLAQWNKDRETAFFTWARGIGTGRPVDSAAFEKLLPTDLPEVTCTAPSRFSEQGIGESIAIVRRSASGLVLQSKVLVNTDRLLWGLSIAALAVDYFQSGDVEALQANSAALVMRALAQGIAAIEVEAVDCDETATETEWDCHAFDSSGKVTRKERLSGATLDEALVYMRSLSRRSAESTCLWQAIHSVSGAPARDFSACREVRLAPSPVKTLETAILSELSFTKGRTATERVWNPEILAQVRGRLLTTASVSRERALAFVARFLATYGDRLDLGKDLERVVPRLVAGIEAARLGKNEKAVKEFAAVGARLLVDRVEDFLDGTLADLEVCQKKRDTSAVCLVRELVDVLYVPVTDYLLEPDPDKRSPASLSRTLLVSFEESNLLERTPLLVNVGLAATSTFGAADSLAINRQTGHFTVVEKFGFAWRFGANRHLELGAFAGGFLDPVVTKTVTGNRPESRWLFGATFGWRRTWGDLPVGFQFHAGGAFPYSFDRDPVPAVGAALVVPIELLANEGD